MDTIKKKSWFEKFKELPLSLRAMVLYLYLLGICDFLNFILSFFSWPLYIAIPVIGVLSWYAAGGLLDRSNSARKFATVLFAIGGVFYSSFILLPIFVDSAEIGFSFGFANTRHDMEGLPALIYIAAIVLFNLLCVFILLHRETRDLSVTSNTVKENE